MKPLVKLFMPKKVRRFHLVIMCLCLALMDLRMLGAFWRVSQTLVTPCDRTIKIDQNLGEQGALFALAATHAMRLLEWKLGYQILL